MSSLKNVLLTLGLATASVSFAGRSWLSPFGGPACNTKLASSELRRETDLRPQGDGNWGWFQVIGYWVDPSRDLVIEVIQKDRKDGVQEARVSFFSLCNGRQLAYGSRVISAYEQNVSSLVVSMQLRDKFSEEDFEVELTAVGQRKKKEVEVVIRRSATDSAHSGQVLDYFRVKKL